VERKLRDPIWHPRNRWYLLDIGFPVAVINLLPCLLRKIENKALMIVNQHLCPISLPLVILAI